MVYHDLGYSTETIFTGVFKGILHFHRFFKAKNPSSEYHYYAPRHRALCSPIMDAVLYYSATVLY